MTRPEYTSDELLPLSGVQHFLFCRRQWALIHVERQWQENGLTVEGAILHQWADDPYFTEKRKGIITTRAVPIASYRLGLSGVCDVIEFTESPEGVQLLGRAGRYLPAPVEYKRGKEKCDHSDEAQLCAQALCLEEMLAVHIAAGYLYYGATRHRVTVPLTDDLRNLVRRAAEEMHAYFQQGYTPRVKPARKCRSCSLADVCLPELQSKVMRASCYIRLQLESV